MSAGNRFRTLFCMAAGVFATSAVNSVRAERPVPSLEAVFPMGVTAGKSAEIQLTGKLLDGLKALLCSTPGFHCEILESNRCRVSVPADALPGHYDLWAISEFGISSPRRFCVSRLAELLESEPNDTSDAAMTAPIGSVINARIDQPGDVDYFRFTARRGQRVVMECAAERIDSRLRAILEVFDAQGKRLAVNRGYHGIDPLIDFPVPEDGDYVIKVHDLISSGGVEHYYRLDIDCGPRAAFTVPSVVQRGQPSRVTVYGWNLQGANTEPAIAGAGLGNSTASQLAAGELDRVEIEVSAAMAQETWPLPVNLSPAQSGLPGFAYDYPESRTPVVIGVTDLPVVGENADNHSPSRAQAISVPSEISGRLSGSHERDWYVFEASRGEVLYFDVISQRIGAPTDADLSLFAANGETLLCEFHDDVKNLGGKWLPTKHLDPGGRWVAPADGRYLLMIRNLNCASAVDPRRSYRLSVRREEPEFSLVLAARSESPHAGNISRGGRESWEVFAVRERGFDGVIRIAARDLPMGWECPEVSLGPGIDHTTVTVSTERTLADPVVRLELEGIAEDGTRRPVRGATVVRSGTPNGWSRLTSQIPVAASGEAFVRATAAIDDVVDHHLYGKVKLRFIPGSVIDIAVTIEQENVAYHPGGKLIGVSMPGMIQNVTAVIPPGEKRGHLSFYLPPTLPVGRYSLAVSAETSVQLADGKTEPATVVSNPVTFDVEPAKFLVEVDPFATHRWKRGETVQLKYSATRCNGFIGKIHTELAAPGVVTNVAGLRGRGETFVGQTDRGSLQIVVNDDAPPGVQPFLRLFSVGVLEDQAIYHGAALFPVEIVE